MISDNGTRPGTKLFEMAGLTPASAALNHPVALVKVSESFDCLLSYCRTSLRRARQTCMTRGIRRSTLAPGRYLRLSRVGLEVELPYMWSSPIQFSAGISGPLHWYGSPSLKWISIFLAIHLLRIC